MSKEKYVSTSEMIEALSDDLSARFPVRITKKNGETIVRYVRGFADQQKNILLISDNAASLALRILEVRDIRTLEYGVEDSDGEWVILHADWLSNTASSCKLK